MKINNEIGWTKFMSFMNTAFQLLFAGLGMLCFVRFLDAKEYFFLFLTALSIGLIIFLNKKPGYSIYIKCPSCKKSIVIKCDWICTSCDKQQGKEKFIFDNCVHCGRILDKVYCEHCHKELEL